MSKRNLKYFRNLLSLVGLCCSIIFLQSACGSGGGGLAGGGPAGVNIKLDPEVLDTGDRTTLTLELGDFRDTNIAIKIRVPTGLAYVTNTAFYVIDGELVDTFPTNNVSDGNNFTYIVFYLSRSTFGDDGRGELILELEGTADIEDGLVDVDIDLDDPAVNNSSEFSVTTPEFTSQDNVFVRVGPEPTSSSSTTGGA